MEKHLQEKIDEVYKTKGKILQNITNDAEMQAALLNTI
jgi:hypothetical protein